MSRKSTLSFVLTLPLVVSGQQDRELQARFQGGRQLYNAVLSEAKVRMDRYSSSPEFKAAKALKKSSERSKVFHETAILYGWNNFALMAFAGEVARRSVWIAEKIDAQVVQTLATRAFQATERIMFGTAKKVRFKGVGWFKSMQGKTNKQGIRFKDGQFV